MRAGLIALLVVIGIAIFAALNSFFIVNPMQQALVLQFGEVRQAIREPGLRTKIPFIQDVQFLDARVLDLNVPAQEIIAEDQKRLVVDAFTRYRIANPVRFYQAVNNVVEGASRLSTYVTSALRAVLADASFQEIVRDDRPDLMLRIKALVAEEARRIGVDIVDVRIRRADLPEANSEAIYARMQTEREQEAREIRAQGQEAAQRVRAAADRNATVLRAEAQREAEQIRGTGDGQKNAIFARAYTQDPQFFSFYRAMQAYEGALASQDTRLVLSPDADFFRYFNDPLGTGSAQSDVGRLQGTDVDRGAVVPGAISLAPPGADGGESPAADGNGAGEGLTEGEVQSSPDPALTITPDGSSDAQPASLRNTRDAMMTPSEESVEEAVLNAPSAASPDANAAADADPAEEAAELESGLTEGAAAAEAMEDGASAIEASTEAAVTSADPAPSPEANAAANGVGAMQRGTVTIVRPGEGGDAAAQ